MRELDDEEEPSGVARVGWVLFLLLVGVAMGLIVWASIEAALAPPMPAFAPGEIQLTAFQKWIVVVVLTAIEAFFVVVLVRHLLVFLAWLGWPSRGLASSRIETSLKR